MEFDSDQFEKTHVVYTHSVNGELIFVGCCLLPEIGLMTAARCNSEWVRVARTGIKIKMAIIAATTDERIAQFHLAITISEHKPYCNINGKPIGNTHKRKQVRCEQTGTLFGSVREAAQAALVTSATMSNHLNKRPGYATIRSKTYGFV